MRKQQILDIDGAVLYEGVSATKRAFIQTLVASGRSLARAQLSRIDLSGLKLDRADFSEADLTGADLRGANLQNATLRKTILAEARLQGARLEHARCEGANLAKAHLSGARLTYATFRGAVLDDADLSRASASSCVFSHVSADRADFSKAWLVNADFGNSTIVGADFSGSHLEHRMFGRKSPELAEQLTRHLPDRTRNAVIVGCTYDKETVLVDTVPAMRSDARISKMAKFGLWAATTLGMVYGGSMLPELLSETEIASQLSMQATGAGFLAVLGGLYLVKEGLGDWAKDSLKSGLDTVVRRVREAMTEMDRHGVHRINLVCAMARDGSAEPLRLALQAKAPEAGRRGFWSSFKSFWSDLGQVILCDRRHLAMALGALSSNRRRTYKLPRDIVLVRCDRDHAAAPSAPCVIGFLKDGRTTAVWPTGPGQHVTTLYDSSNNYVGCWGEGGRPVDPGAAGLPDVHARGIDAVFAFEEALLTEHGLAGFSYPADTHYLLAGRDGSLFVHRAHDRRLDNPAPNAPALILPNDSGYRVRNGSIQGEWMASAAVPARGF